MLDYQLLADRIRALPVSARAAIAVVSAQRLMDHHMSLPLAQRDPFIVALAPDLDRLWQALSSQSSEPDVALRNLLKKRDQNLMPIKLERTNGRVVTTTPSPPQSTRSRHTASCKLSSQSVRPCGLSMPPAIWPGQSPRALARISCPARQRQGVRRSRALSSNG